MSYKTFLSVLSLVLMASCQAVLPVPLDTARVSSTDSPAPNLIVPSSTPIPLPPSPSVTLTQQVPSPSPAPLATITPSPTASFQLCSPLGWETIPELWEIISDPYNPPPAGRDERHQGVDFSHYSRKGHKTIEGEPVQAALAGRVAAAIQNRLPYGNMVIIETTSDNLPVAVRIALGMAEGESLYLLYAHLGQYPPVNVGDQVGCGQVIGEVGMTGYNVANPHLHLETRIGPPGVTFESMAFYTTSATEKEMENYRRWRTSGEFRHFDPMKLFEWFKNKP